MCGCAYVFAGSVTAGVYEVDATRSGFADAKESGVVLSDVDQGSCAPVMTKTANVSTAPPPM
jgi:hypothetical protein